jgi:hypothetical protein
MVNLSSGIPADLFAATCRKAGLEALANGTDNDGQDQTCKERSQLGNGNPLNYAKMNNPGKKNHLDNGCDSGNSTRCNCSPNPGFIIPGKLCQPLSDRLLIGG